MNFEEIKELLQFVDKSSLSYLELKESDLYIKIDKSLNRNINSSKEVTKTTSDDNEVKDIKVIENNEVKKQEVKKTNEVKETEEFILSPMVGTFYSKPAPDKDAFVTIGEKVSRGKVICIIEAMKLMNEIECEFDGEILEILVKDGEMVEYGQPLYKIKK